MAMNYKVGDTIEIDYMKDEPRYNGRRGIITEIGKDFDGYTVLYGTWGGLAVYPYADNFHTVKEADLNGKEN